MGLAAELPKSFEVSREIIGSLPVFLHHASEPSYTCPFAGLHGVLILHRKKNIHRFNKRVVAVCLDPYVLKICPVVGSCHSLHVDIINQRMASIVLNVIRNFF